MPKSKDDKIDKGKKDWGKPLPEKKCSTLPSTIELAKMITAPLDTKKYKAIELTSNKIRSVLISTCMHDLDLKEKCKYRIIEKFNETVIGIKPSSSYKLGCCGLTDDDIEPSGVKSCSNKACGTEQMVCCTGVASACLVVGVGSLSDPSDVPGMAHLLEHCLLLGSANFPKENNLFPLIKQLGGHINAVTMAEYTYYHFNCNSVEFEKALKAFSDMITAPLLRASSIKKEVSAVDSEFTLVNTCDFTRATDFMGYLAKKDHPVFKFSWGDKESLSNPDLEEKLKTWHKHNYSANHMTLCLHGPYSIEELERMASTYFSNVPNNCYIPQEELATKGDPYDPETFYKTYQLVPKSHVRHMFISWCLPPRFWQDFEAKPLLYLKILMNTEGKGGLCDYLRKKHWITRFNSGCSKGDNMLRNSFVSIYQFSISLTDEGLKNRDGILLAVFSYIKFLKQKGPQKRIYDELMKTQANTFHYHDWDEITNCTIEYALNVQIIKDPKHFLTSTTLITKYDPETIEDMMKLMDHRKANVIVMARQFANLESLINIKNGRFVYQVEEISEEMNRKLENIPIYPEFQLPAPNTFLSKELGHPNHPNNFLNLPESKKPKIMFEDPYGRFTIFLTPDQITDTTIGPVTSNYKPFCSNRRLPYAIFTLEFYSRLGTLENRPLMKMWVYLLNLFMGNKFGTAYDTLHKYAILSKNDILIVDVEGPTYHMTTLVQDILTIFETFEKQLEEDRVYFEDEKADLLDGFYNSMLDIEEYPIDILNYILEQNGLSQFHHKQKLKRTNYIEFTRFVKRFGSQMFIKVETTGAVRPEQIEDIKRSLNGLKFRSYRNPLSSSPNRATLLPNGCMFLRIRVRSPAVNSSTTVNHYQFGNLQDEVDIGVFHLLHAVLVKNSFLQLRTQEQLGYRVHLYKWEKCDCLGLTFKVIVKADKYTTEYVDKRMDNFIQDFFNFHFNTEKAFKELTSPFKFGKIPFKRAREIYKNYLLPGGENYRKLSIQVVGYKPLPLGFLKATDDSELPWIIYDQIPSEQRHLTNQFINDVQEFKRSLKLQPNLNPQLEEDEE